MTLENKFVILTVRVSSFKFLSMVITTGTFSLTGPTATELF